MLAWCGGWSRSINRKRLVIPPIHGFVRRRPCVSMPCISVSIAHLAWPILTINLCCRSVEDFSYFTLRYCGTTTSRSTSAFGISCTRQLDARDLKERPKDVTRSTVQKAVVCIAESPKCFGQLREKLSMVTEAWFAQK